MKIKGGIVLIAANVLFSANASSMVEPSSIVVSAIETGKMENDNGPTQFSVLINLQNTGSTINKWSFGFYMPRTFATSLPSGVNPELDMQICTADGNKCANLKYLKASSLNDSDLSQGYFTLLEPLVNFPLEKAGRYLISLRHNNQGVPTNLSAMPQSLFMITDNYTKNNVLRIYTLATEASSYHILGYNQESVDQALNARLMHNWQHSQPVQASAVGIVPLPVVTRMIADTSYLVPSNLSIHNQLNSDNQVESMAATWFKQDLHLKTDLPVDNDATQSQGIIITAINDPKSINNAAEGYRLTISNDGIMIEALTQAGAYYALQTLRQLLAAHPDKRLPGLVITDYPRYKYRGILLDLARHYFSSEEIKTLIAVMASQKLNTLHLHLADDEALRVAVPGVHTPAVAATRGLGQALGPTMLMQTSLDSTNRHGQTYPLANSVYAHSFSVDEIREIINYANANQITIIPEIDLPGHARALIKALPEVMYDPNDDSQFLSVQGYSDNVVPVCTYATSIAIGPQFSQTINNLINGINQLFQQQTTVYAQENELSIGGDEVSPNAWTNDVSCKSEWGSLSALGKSQLFATKLAESNSEIIFSGWQQLVQNDNGTMGNPRLDATRVGHIWVWDPSRQGIAQAAQLAQNNYPTVLAFADKSYFDLAYNPSMYEPGFNWATAYADTYQVLSLAAAATQVEQQTANAANVVGLEGALWSENLASFDHLMYMALPKMPALAEAAWTPAAQTTNDGKLNWQSLATRLGCGKTGFLAYLQQQFSVNYHGYPHGIQSELPINNWCNLSSELSQD